MVKGVVTKKESLVFSENCSIKLGCQLESLINIIDKKDAITGGHSYRVALLAAKIASNLGMNKNKIEIVEIAGMVHDIGKVGVPAHILCKKGILTTNEMEMMRDHPRIGWEILKDVSFMDKYLDGILYHHEHFDGNGYPFGLRGKEIPLIARILSVADSYDAMTTDRPYRRAMSSEHALKEIYNQSGQQFDPYVVEALNT